MPHASQTVIIVGAGIAGLSTSFHLADKGVRKILLLDKGRVGDGSSSRSGAINTMMMATEGASRARGITFDIFERFDKILENYDFHQVGCLNLLDPEQFERSRQLHPMHRRAGARFLVLRRREIEERFPDLRIGDDEHGVLDLRGGYSEPDRYLPALSAKVRDMGVEIREGVTVEDFLVEGGRVTGVRTRESGELRADSVVCTVNAWANSLMAEAGQPLAVRNFVHERWVTMPLGHSPRLPATNDDAKGVYYRPTEDDRVLLGTGAHEAVQIERPGPDFRLTELVPDPRSLPFIQEAVRDRLPLIQGVEIDYHRVGLVSYALDFLPNIGPVKALPGLYLAVTFNSGGFGYHPVAGFLLAEYMVDGQTSIDASEFSPDRFLDFDTEGYLAGTVTHGQMIQDHEARTALPVRKRH